MTWFSLLLLAALPVSADAWPAFLGAGAAPLAPERLPLQWSATDHVAWRATLPGHGQSSPVIWGGRVFTTSVDGPNKDTYYTTCVDLASGRQLWQQTLDNSSPVPNSYYVSRAAPTPVVDAERVIAFFESGDCVAYSHAGKELWRRQLGQEECPLNAEFGLGASPCQNETHLFVLLDHDAPGCLLSLDKASGKTAWKVERSPRRSWSSPVLARIAGQPQIVVSSAGSVDGYDPQTGRELWTFTDIGGNTGTTPLAAGEGRFLIGASPGRNGENAGSAADSNCLLEVTHDGQNWKAERKWVAQGAMPSWASPIVHRGLAYWINRAGVVSCFDATTGERLFAKRIEQPCWATPIAAGDRIYFFGQQGAVTVLAAGREFEVLAENQSWSDDTLPAEPPLPEEESEERRRAAAMFSKPTLYGAAVAEGTIVLRVGNGLIAVRQ